MPNRIVRADILTSERVARLSWPAEVFYRRLMSVVDDFGRYDGRNSVLRTALYPIQTEKVTEGNIGKWKQESADAGLVTVYAVEGKEFVQIERFGDPRAIRSKYPSPADGVLADTCAQMRADASKCAQTKADAPVFVSVFESVSVSENEFVNCPEPPKTAASGPATGFAFPCSGPIKEWHCPEALISDLRGWFLGLDVEVELRRAQAWCVTNPTRRKTAKRMPAFLSNWFQNAQNKLRVSPSKPASGGGDESFLELAQKAEKGLL